MKNNLIIATIILVIVLAGGLVFWQMRDSNTNTSNQTVSNTNTSSTSSIDTNDNLDSALEDLEQVDE